MATPAPSSDNIILGKGELFFDPFDANGVRQGKVHLGNCQKFAIILNDDVASLNTSQAAAGGLLKRVTRSREVNIEISSNEFGMENLAIALMGAVGSLAQTSSAITGETLGGVTAVAKGKFYKTNGRQITGAVITQGTVTWALGTDYTIHDATAGLIRVLPTASTAVNTATVATIAYTRASLSLQTITGAIKTKLEGSLYFVPDPTTGPQYDVEVFKVSVTPGGEVGMITQDFGEYTLSMAALDDSAGTYGGSAGSPYFTMVNRGQA